MDLAVFGGFLGFLTFAWNLIGWVNSHVRLQAELREGTVPGSREAVLRIENPGSTVRRVAYAGLLVGPDDLTLWQMLREVADVPVPRTPGPVAWALARMGMPDAAETALLRGIVRSGPTVGGPAEGGVAVRLRALPYFFADQHTVGQGELLQYPVVMADPRPAGTGGPLRLYFFVLITYPFGQIRIRSTSELFVPAAQDPARNTGLPTVTGPGATTEP